jgi:YesN/AraC family two-component response regulator
MNGAKKRVLFVDDEPLLLRALQALLRTERARWDMEFALGADEAMRAFTMTPFDVVVSDMRMPGKDGATLLGEVRRQQPGTRCVLLSGYADDALLARATPHCDVVLNKPCRAPDLVKTIEELVERGA